MKSETNSSGRQLHKRELGLACSIAEGSLSQYADILADAAMLKELSTASGGEGGRGGGGIWGTAIAQTPPCQVEAARS